MVSKIQKWGNSQGIRLSRQTLGDAGIEIGDPVDVVVRDGLILVAPAKRVRGRMSLQDLVARMPKKYKPEELDWGPPVGREVW